MNHRIDLPGVGNARELGGYIIGDKLIKNGVLLRTARLDQAEPEAIKRLEQEYHVQTVIDFRMSEESRQRSDPHISGAENLSLPMLEMEDMPSADPKALRLYSNPKTDRMRLFEMVYETGMVSQELYTDFLLRERGKRAFRGFFEALLSLEPGRAILWHCADGKDRTGCAAMLLLFALGSSRETVMEDYLLTNVYNTKKLDSIWQQAAPLNFDPQKLDTLLFVSGGVIEGYMHRAIDTLVERYGSVTGYLSQELGIDEPKREALRAKFLI